MKVLFQIRPGYKEGPSGDSVQMFMTKVYLEKLGVKVSISSRADIDLKNFDIIHIFNTMLLSEAYSFYKNAVNQKKRIIVSPIFIDMHLYHRKSPARLAAWRAENLIRREIFQGSNMLLPNSQRELEWIKNILMVNTKAKVIYHGVEPVFFNANSKWFIEKYGMNNFILCVGRLSPIKNQLSLIRAVKDLNIPIVLIGPVNNMEYAMKCAEEADGCVKYIPPLNHIELASAYCAASIHVQPSWFETVGLSSLEAAATGTPIVTTVQGAAQEYFGDKAIYVEPDSLESIRTGILTAMKQPTDIEQNNKNVTPKSERNQLEIKTYIKDRFTWDKTAKNTLDAYEQVLADDEIKVNESFYSQTYKLPELE